MNLPLRTGAFRTTLNRGMFGALRDASPDFWGRMIIERRHSPEHELDYLLAASDSRVGALSFAPTPSPPAVEATPVIALGDLQRALDAADAMERSIGGHTEPGDLDPALLEPSSGMGGARPKTVVADDGGVLWVAKFPSRSDRWDNAVAEGTYLRLAKRCGIRAAESRLLEQGDRSGLLVRRFDRAGNVRRAFLSAHTLLGLDDSVLDRAGWSYVDLAHLLRRISVRPEEDARELFRRAVFNTLTSNADDHPRNHAVIREEDGWRLSPAFDLTPSVGRSQDRRLLAMAVGQLQGVEPRWANRANLVSGAEHFGFSPEEADALISEMKDCVVAEWREVAGELGGSQGVAPLIEHAFPDRYPGFEYPAE